MTAIIDIHGRQILDSRGNPTIEVDVQLESGVTGPCGCTVGGINGCAYEAVELRDGDKDVLSWVRVLQKAVNFVNTEIYDALIGMANAEEQMDIDRAMIDLDGTENKARLGCECYSGRVFGGCEGDGRWSLLCHFTVILAGLMRIRFANADDEYY